MLQNVKVKSKGELCICKMYRVLIECGINKSVLEFLHSSGWLEGPRLCQCPHSFAPWGCHYEIVLYQTPKEMIACLPSSVAGSWRNLTRPLGHATLAKRPFIIFFWLCRWNPGFKHARWVFYHTKLQVKNCSFQQMAISVPEWEVLDWVLGRWYCRKPMVGCAWWHVPAVKLPWRSGKKDHFDARVSDALFWPLWAPALRGT